jgi:ABC-type Zn2+ transport system substrate-binding protein/surface adhesin
MPFRILERRFGLTVAGAVTVVPDSAPGARRVAA